MRPLIIDSFAGGGGASTGIEMALVRSPDIAINHNADALAMHEVNHPATLHLSTNIWKVDPFEAVGNRKVGLAWFSPDCKHFSKAKGGRPVKRNIRDLAWVVVLWAKRARPAVIMLENVEEFQDWGPLVEREPGVWVPCPERKGAIFKTWTKELRRLGYKLEFRELRACDYGAPTIRKRFFMIARCDGKPIVWPEPTHGAPDDPDVIAGRKLPWRTAAEIIDWSIPCPSIFDTAEEIKAKFGIRAIRPLADATMKRIARGVVRYVLEAKKPFVVSVAHGYSGGRREYPIDALMGTQTSAGNAHAVVVPVITAGQHGGSVRDVEKPIHTITASSKDQNAVIAAHLTKFQTGSTGAPLDEPAPTVTANSYVKKPGGAAPIGLAAVHLSRFNQNGIGHGADEPLDTVMAGAAKFGLVAASLVPQQENEHHGERSQAGRSDTFDADFAEANDEHADLHDSSDGDPSLRHAATGQVRTGSKARNSADLRFETQNERGQVSKCATVAAFLAQHNNDSRRIGGVNPGRPADEPLATLTASGAQQQVVAAHLMNMRGSDRRDQPIDKPAPTATAGGTHAALIAAFLTKYYGEGLPNQAADEPMHTLTTLPRHGLVTVEIDGATYAITDIGMRMLTPRERFRAQGFPDDYIIDRRPDGSPITATVQGSCCGNSVCPPLAKALVAANCADLAEFREAAE